MRRLFLILILSCIAILGKAQYGNYLQLTAVELLQYQQQKLRKMPTVAPFKRYGLRRIRVSKYLDDSDPRHIWGWHLQPNEQYEVSEPLYKLFRKTDESSLAVIDTQGGVLGQELLSTVCTAIAQHRLCRQQQQHRYERAAIPQIRHHGACRCNHLARCLHLKGRVKTCGFGVFPMCSKASISPMNLKIHRRNIVSITPSPKKRCLFQHLLWCNSCAPAQWEQYRK